MRLILDVAELADSSDRFAPEAFLARFDTTLDFLLSSLTPDQQIPWIGAASAGRVSGPVRAAIARRTGNPASKHIEQHIAFLANSMSVFPDYGHAYVRGSSDSGLYLAFYAGQNLPAGKRHEDALSLILMHQHRVWITEGGHLDYEPTAVNRHLASPEAHNTYILGASHYGELDAPEARAGLLSAEHNGTLIILKGFTERFPLGGRVDREVRISLDTPAITLVDTFERSKPSGSASFQGRLIFPGDLVVTFDEPSSTVLVTDPASGTTMLIHDAQRRMTGVSIARGQADPPLGWTVVDDRLVEATCLTYNPLEDAPLELNIRWIESAARHRSSDR